MRALRTSCNSEIEGGLRFGLIGCGGIGVLRAQALRKAGGARLTAVSDLNQEQAQRLASLHGAAVESDWQTLVRRADVDAVIVSTPHSLHAAMCIAALQAGKHVLCEKPLARTPAEGRRIVEAAKDSGRLMATGFNFRFLPSVQKARELLDADVIGDLNHIRSYGGYSASEHTQLWLHDVEVSGGGALHDNGIHLIDLTRYFLGEVAEVKGFASERVWQFPGCEDIGFAVLRGTSGRIASLGASWTDWRGFRFGLELHGTHGCLEVSCFPMIVRVTTAAERGGPTRRRTYAFPMTHLCEKLFSYRWVVVQSFVKEFQAFAGAVRGESTTLATGLDGLRALEIAAAVARVPVDGLVELPRAAETVH